MIEQITDSGFFWKEKIVELFTFECCNIRTIERIGKILIMILGIIEMSEEAVEGAMRVCDSNIRLRCV